jgi:hypothetical protein
LRTYGVLITPISELPAKSKTIATTLCFPAQKTFDSKGKSKSVNMGSSST